jgi:hypothetical protein
MFKEVLMKWCIRMIAKMAVSLNVNQLWLSTTPPCSRDIVLAESTII